MFYHRNDIFVLIHDDSESFTTINDFEASVDQAIAYEAVEYGETESISTSYVGDDTHFFNSDGYHFATILNNHLIQSDPGVWIA